MKILGVEWKDPTSFPGWRNDLEEICYTDVYTVGMFVEETDDSIKLAQSVSASGQPADVVVIAKKNIVVAYWVNPGKTYKIKAKK